MFHFCSCLSARFENVTCLRRVKKIICIVCAKNKTVQGDFMGWVVLGLQLNRHWCDELDETFWVKREQYRWKHKHAKRIDDLNSQEARSYWSRLSNISLGTTRTWELSYNLLNRVTHLQCSPHHCSKHTFRVETSVFDSSCLTLTLFAEKIC